MIESQSKPSLPDVLVRRAGHTSFAAAKVDVHKQRAVTRLVETTAGVSADAKAELSLACTLGGRLQISCHASKFLREGNFLLPVVIASVLNSK